MRLAHEFCGNCIWCGQPCYEGDDIVVASQSSEGGEEYMHRTCSMREGDFDQAPLDIIRGKA